MSDSELRELRRRIVEVATEAGEGHIPSALSILDIIYVLYDKILQEQDSFVLSKGHGCLALYVVLEHIKQTLFPLDTFCRYESKFGGHPDSIKLSGAVFSTGSLGHGLPQSVGLAYGLRNTGRVFCLVGDQECNEGTFYESLLLVKKLNLSNLTIIIDNNHSAENSLPLPDLTKIFESFDWHTYTPRGHDHQMLHSALSLTYPDQPAIVIAETVKGYGIPVMMEDPRAWHHRAPKNAEEYRSIMDSIR